MTFRKVYVDLRGLVGRGLLDTFAYLCANDFLAIQCLNTSCESTYLDHLRYTTAYNPCYRVVYMS